MVFSVAPCRAACAVLRPRTRVSRRAATPSPNSRRGRARPRTLAGGRLRLPARPGGAAPPWFSPAAVLPALSREWHLGDGGRAGLTVAVQAGFILGTLGSALANLPDLVSPPPPLLRSG